MKKKSGASTKQRLGVSEQLNKAPEGILILVFLLFSAAILTFSFSLWMLTAADEFASNSAAYAQTYQGLNISEMTFINFGVLSLFFSLLFYFLGKGLLRFENRARLVFLVLLAVVFVSSLYNAYIGAMFYTSTYLILLCAVGMWYLTKRSTVVYFK